MKTWRTWWLIMAVVWASNFAHSQTWIKTTAPATNWSAIVCSADGTKVMAAAAGSRSGGGGIWVSTNSGSQWTQTSVPAGEWRTMASSADGLHLIVTSTPGEACQTTNLWKTWTTNNGVPADGWVSVASSADGSTLLVIAPIPLSPTGEDILLVSTNSGASWFSTNVLSADSVAASADGTKLVAAEMGFCYSTNSGSQWIPSGLFATEVYSIVSSANGSFLAAISGTSIIVSTNYGLAWTTTSAPATNWDAVGVSADGSRLVAACGASRSLPISATNGPIYTSTNSGSTWMLNNAPAQSWFAVACSADGGKLYAAANTSGGSGGIWTADVIPQPSLNASSTNGSLQLSWTVPSTNIVVQQSSNLQTWTSVTNQPVLNLKTLQNQIILSSPGSNGFYRLQAP